jgi:hypothetical protein
MRTLLQKNAQAQSLIFCSYLELWTKSNVSQVFACLLGEAEVPCE